MQPSLQTEKNTAIMPKRLNRNTIATFCNRINHIKNDINSNKNIYLDATELMFIDSLAMTILFNVIGDMVHAENWQIEVLNYHDETGEPKEAIRFMDDLGFFQLVSGKRLSNEPHRSETNLLMKRLSPNQTLMWILNTAIPWMARKLNVLEDDLDSLKCCLEELFTNVSNHSGVEFSNIFIQTNPRSSEVNICLHDNGIGLIDKIKSQKEYSELDDKEIIRRALQEGFTTTACNNRGRGLSILMRNVHYNGGQFSIRTGNTEALIIPSNNSSEPNIYLLRGMKHLQGTAFEITLYADSFNSTKTDNEPHTQD